MKRNEAIELLEQFEKFCNEDKYGSLLSFKNGKERFLESKWAKENLPVDINITTGKDFGRTDRKNLSIHFEQLKEESLIQKLIKDDPEFKKGIEDIAKRLSDRHPETR